jgi:hypothetical protein
MTMEDLPMDQPQDDSQFTPEIMAELQAAIERAVNGIRKPEAMRKACERLDRTREEIFRRNGLLDFAVPTIRAPRDGDDE